jgi:hypothetical protein
MLLIDCLMTATKLRRHTRISINRYRNLFYKQFKSFGLWVDLQALEMSTEVRTGLHVQGDSLARGPKLLSIKH